MSPACGLANSREGDRDSKEYKPGAAFNGDLQRMTVDVSGDLLRDHDAEARVLMARQYMPIAVAPANGL